MEDEMKHWADSWTDEGASHAELMTSLGRARREAMSYLVVSWGILFVVVAVGARLSLRLPHPAVWGFFTLFAGWLTAWIIRFTWRERAERREGALDVARGVVELQRRTQLALSTPKRFWTLNVLLGAAMLWLPWQLWFDGVLYADDAPMGALALTLFNVTALFVVASQIIERRKQQRELDAIADLVRELEGARDV